MTLAEHLTTAITATTNPDSHEAVGALLLATHTATRVAAAVDDDGAAWDFCALSLVDATAEVRAGTADEIVLSPAVSAANADDWAVTAHAQHHTNDLSGQDLRRTLGTGLALTHELGRLLTVTNPTTT